MKKSSRCFSRGRGFSGGGVASPLSAQSGFHPAPFLFLLCVWGGFFCPFVERWALFIVSGGGLEEPA